MQASLKESYVYWHSAEEEVRQAGQIMADKPHLLRCLSGSRDIVLTQLWRDTDIFGDLPQSSAHADQFHSGLYDPEQGELRAFWAQF